MMSFDDIAFRITKQGSDNRNLGRWIWVTLTDKYNSNTTIVTCYCPCKGRSMGSVYSQQLIYMTDNRADLLNNLICPRKLYGLNLRLLIEKTRLRHHMLICGEFNSVYRDFKNWMLDTSLVNLLEIKYGLGPRTYKKPKDCPIYCAFGSPSLKINKGGYLSFRRLQSDHRGFWMDIPIRWVMGHKQLAITYFNARQLDLIDPRVVKNTKNILHKHANNKVYSREWIYYTTRLSNL